MNTQSKNGSRDVVLNADKYHRKFICFFRTEVYRQIQAYGVVGPVPRWGADRLSLRMNEVMRYHVGVLCKNKVTEPIAWPLRFGGKTQIAQFKLYLIFYEWMILYFKLCKILNINCYIKNCGLGKLKTHASDATAFDPVLFGDAHCLHQNKTIVIIISIIKTQ